MSAQVRARMRQFDDPQNVDDLLNLPTVLVGKARQAFGKPTQASALLVQTALAIGFLLMSAMRRANLVQLHLDKHSIRSKSGDRQLFIAGAEVKNGTDIEMAIPPHRAVLIDLYVTEYRPLLCATADSPWLFPGGADRPKSRKRMGLQVSRRSKKSSALT